jgi:hypothetical protein
LPNDPEQPPDAGETFNEVKETLDASDKVYLAEVESKQAPRIKIKPKRKTLPKDLPRKVVTIDLPVDEQVCDCCHNRLHKIGGSRMKSLSLNLLILRLLKPFALSMPVSSVRKQVQRIILKPH